jgi:acyl-CoA synthetase (AMP-forming)/AMP-acid ligase II
MQTIFRALAHFAETTPAKPAIVVGRKGQWTQFSFADLQDETERWARTWRGQCDTPGSVVFLIAQHGMAMYPAFLGAMRAGLIPSFLPYPTPKQDPELYWRSHKTLFARVQPACILSYAELLPTLRDSGYRISFGMPLRGGTAGGAGRERPAQHCLATA